ncbi:MULTISPECIES: hypothetical protein [Paenibacillus]|jgi:hypothetical protein|uniref:Uncharacterized protein n=2 Tax=Paenibacillus TaxID=44249 RepID=A0AAJ2JUE4_9BACL|nr:MULTISPECIES: hypothetical protein [Paenibacillus]MCM3289054.1 hypothetical protein [Paenibacillus sp. MER 180]MCY9530708.1 hypothetical protein [Paenibacillus alvei]MDT8977253.1 hypothetical protein [Paenibacillus sp. chi10]SDF14541.1 hypothetical protein SAMN04488689_103767 [Paenibacillus sp. cl6col]GAV14062.1 hypothetical protein PBN151_4024 [Paenibacillus sp. NAIST15-1]
MRQSLHQLAIQYSCLSGMQSLRESAAALQQEEEHRQATRRNGEGMKR